MSDDEPCAARSSERSRGAETAQAAGATTAVFLCRCGDAIAGAIDLDALADELRRDPAVACVEAHEMLCTPDGRRLLEERIRASGAQRVVVAACSPREIEASIRESVQRAGINGYLMQIANLREHCAWVTPCPDEALRKGLSLCRAAVQRVARQEALEHSTVDFCADVLVVGGGVAGVEAALAAAEAGRNVTLIDAAPSVGGAMMAMEEVAPQLQCAACALSPRLSVLAESQHVRLLTSTRIEKVAGFVGSFVATAVKLARYVDESACLGYGCDACSQACPVTMPSARGLVSRKAVEVPFGGAVPNCAVIDRAHCLRFKGEECRACADACPVGAIAFEQEDEPVDVRAGTIVLATGASESVPVRSNPWGYGQLDDVYTLGEVEILANSNGPTAGRLLTRSGQPPHRVAVIHCAGRKELGYCSSYCCESALKTALVLAKNDGACETTHIVSDLVLWGAAGQGLLDRAASHGARILRVPDPEASHVAKVDGALHVAVEREGAPAVEMDVDMVVLATGLRPSAGTARLAAELGLPLEATGFPRPDSPTIRASGAAVDGVFLAGTAGGPRGVRASAESAHAAAALALVRGIPGKQMVLEACVARVTPELCGNCQICVRVCPFKAWQVDRSTGRAACRETLCRGCGVCAAACPGTPIAALHFTDAQLRAEIQEVLRG